VNAAGVDLLRPFRVPMRRRFRGGTERTGVLLRGTAGGGGDPFGLRRVEGSPSPETVRHKNRRDRKYPSRPCILSKPIE